MVSELSVADFVFAKSPPTAFGNAGREGLIARLGGLVVVSLGSVVCLGLIVSLGLVASLAGSLTALADVVPVSCTGRSRTTSAAFLSSLNPWKDGWRKVPSWVHSVKAISATNCGLTQCTPLASKPRGGLTKGLELCDRPSSLRRSDASILSLNPVPTLPE